VSVPLTLRKRSEVGKGARSASQGSA